MITHRLQLVKIILTCTYASVMKSAINVIDYTQATAHHCDSTLFSMDIDIIDDIVHVHFAKGASFLF